MVRELLSIWRINAAGLGGERFDRLLQRIADVLHKRRAALLVLLIQTLGLLELLIHQNFPVLIANNENLGAR